MSRLWPKVSPVLKWSGIVVGSLVLIGLLLFGVAFAINSRDEPLTPQAQALLQPPPNPCKPQDNLYLAIQGFDAPPGESVTAVGEARIAHYNHSVDALLRDPSAARLASLRTQDPQRLDFRGDVSFLHPLDGSVWNEAPRHEAAIERLLADNSELYRRYLALLDLRAYCETARPSEFAPFPVTPTEVRKLFLATIALHLRSVFAHERELALADLESDVQLWRTVLTARGGLLWKMLSVAYLQSDYLLLADLIADAHVALPRGAAQADWFVPVFDVRDWDIGNAFAAEFRTLASALSQTDDLPATAWSPEGRSRSGISGWLKRTENRMTGRFFKLDATENLIARETGRRILAAADPTQFYRTARRAGDFLLEGQTVWSLPLSYNPIGKVLAAVAVPAYDNYPPRAWDAAALQRLVRAGYEIRRRGLDAAAIPAFLEGHPEWSTHPADGRPFLWSAATGELRIRTLTQHPPGRRFGIRVWQAASAG